MVSAIYYPALNVLYVHAIDPGIDCKRSLEHLLLYNTRAGNATSEARWQTTES